MGSSVASDIDRMTARLGQQVRAWRIRKGVSQASLAKDAGVSDLAVRRLETGSGSTLATLMGVLKALGHLDRLSQLIDPVTVSPLEKVGRNTQPVAQRAPFKKRA